MAAKRPKSSAKQKSAAQLFSRISRRSAVTALTFILLFGGIGLYLFAFSGATAGTPELKSALTDASKDPYCLNDPGNSYTPKTKLYISTCAGTDGQQWDVVDESNGGMTIRHAPGNTYCLTVLGGGKTDGTPVVQEVCSAHPTKNAPSQIWKRYKQQGYINPQSGKCLDVPDSNVKASIDIWDCGALRANAVWGVGEYVPASAASSANSTYENPFRDISNLQLSRIDQGVDFGGSGKVYALGAGKIVAVISNPGSGWGSPPEFTVERLSDGLAAGRYVYVAEDCTPTVSVGASVTVNTEICSMYNTSEGIETGWASPPVNGQYYDITLAHGCFDGSDSTTYGVNYADLLHTLGQKTDSPSATVTCPSSTGLPNW